MNNRLMKTLLGGVSFAALSSSAPAAEMAVKAPPPSQAPVYSWTGFYGGLHGGAGWSAHGDGTVTQQDLTGVIPPSVLTAPFTALGFGGVQVGYNWQLPDRWIVGLETDISASTHSETNGQLVVPGLGGGVNNINVVRGFDWFGTMRARAGYLYSPAMLVYATGGVAYGHMRNDLNQSFVFFPAGVPNQNFAANAASTGAGWTVGGGIELAIDRKWSMKLEYQYLAFNDSLTTVNVVTGAKVNAAYFGQLPDSSAHTVQVGLNYHFWN